MHFIFRTNELTFHWVLQGRRCIYSAHNVAEAMFDRPHVQAIVVDAETVLRGERHAVRLYLQLGLSWHTLRLG